MDEKEIERLRVVYNKEHPNLPPIETGKDTWKELQKRFHSECKSGRAECVIAHMLSKSDAPSSWRMNPEEWLSSIDIEKVEKQYMKLFPRYYFVGCVPIDFDLHSETGKCLVNALCSIKITDLAKQGYTQVGIVFNTDVHTGPGQHWVALFCDCNPDREHATITYFDSYAQKPEREIQVLMHRWADQLSMPVKKRYNTTRHQFQDSECGMYCLYFHYACLTEIPMEERIPDKVVNTFRKLLFRVKK